MNETYENMITNAHWSDYGNHVISSVSFALLYYDFALTMPLEVKHFWGRRLSWPSALYFLNRYFSVVSHLPIVYKDFGNPSKLSCEQLQLYHGFLEVISQGLVAALLIVRTYALHNRSRDIVIFLSVFVAFGGAMAIWALIQTIRGVHDPSGDANIFYNGCVLMLSESQGKRYAIAWSAGLVFDTVVFVITLSGTLRSGFILRGGLFYLIMRDGTIYFGILLVCYLANVLSFVYAAPGYRGCMATFTNVLSSILVTRMMLNIRDHDPCPESSLIQKSKETSLQFYHPHMSVTSRQSDIVYS
ncbi:hypothetical protein C8Q74DRAFT_1309082 [Fomes fomentarius]|nr:hypothetical protein C8Q74DRAFT_1309082 [Fomes fomentarius]